MVDAATVIRSRCPPGWPTATTSRCAAWATPGRAAARRATCIVLIEEKDHEVFERDGDDLHLELPVSFGRSRSAGEIEVPTLGGATHPLDVPAGTQSGKCCACAGKGLPRLRGAAGRPARAPARVDAVASCRRRGKQLFEELSKLEEGRTPKPGKSLFDRVKDAFGG